MGIDEFDLQRFVALARSVGSDTASVEVKAAAGGLPRDVVESVSAFSNASGGVIVCGLSEVEGFSPAAGFDAKRISEALAQACSDRMEPPVRPEIALEAFEGSRVVVARIPETAPHLKPCYVKARGPYEGSFIRVGEGDRRLSRYEVDRLMEERSQPRHDMQVVPEAEVSELDEELLGGFLRRERANSPRVFGRLSDEDALVSLGVLGLDADGMLRPTLAGLMAFAVFPQRHVPRANVTFAAFPGRSKGVPGPDGARFLDSRTIDGPIPVMIAETMASVRRNMKVASYVNGAGRVDVPEYPEVAVREAVANALMHRDYSPEGLGSQVQVNLYQDRIEVLSPGGLYGGVTVDTLGTYGVSATRNQRLSRLLESAPFPEGYPERGYVVENKGTGYAQIQESLRACGMRSAEPYSCLSFFALTMYRGRAGQEELAAGAGSGSAMVAGGRPMRPDFTYGGLAGPVGAAGTAGVASPVVAADYDSQILDLAAQQGSVSTSEVAELLGVSAATALRRLKGLVERGRLRRLPAGGRSTRYAPSD